MQRLKRNRLRRGRRRKRLLSDVLLDFLKFSHVPGHLILLGSELILVGGQLSQIAPHDSDIERNELHLLRHLRQNISVCWRLGVRLRRQPGE